MHMCHIAMCIPALLYLIFAHYPRKGTIANKKLSNIKYVF